MSWYVLEVLSGKEISAVHALRAVGYGAFSPSRILPERRGGVWKDVERMMLPGYVFLSAQMSAEDWHRAMATDGAIRILGANGPEPVLDAEAERMRVLGNGGEAWGVSIARIIRRGVNEDGADEIDLIVDSGPLKGLEDWIVAFEPRRRRALVAVRLPGGEEKAIALGMLITNDLQADGHICG